MCKDGKYNVKKVVTQSAITIIHDRTKIDSWQIACVVTSNKNRE